MEVLKKKNFYNNKDSKQQTLGGNLNDVAQIHLQNMRQNIKKLKQRQAATGQKIAVRNVEVLVGKTLEMQ